MPRTEFLCAIAVCQLLFATSCGNHPTGEPKTPDTEARASDNVRHEEVSPIYLCRAVHQSSKIPVSCTFEVIEGEPQMLIGVRSEAVLGEQLDDLVKHLVVPFCRDQNQAGQASGVFFNVGTRARHLDCSNFRMSDWVESNPVVAQTVAIEESCNSVQQGNYGVRCAMMTVEGTPALILSYASDAGALDNLVGITREVGGSFCQLSLATSVPATIVLLDEQFVGRFYDCSTARLSEPIPFVKQRRQPVAPAPATPQPSKPVPANTRPANTVLASLDQRWDLLPQRR